MLRVSSARFNEMASTFSLLLAGTMFSLLSSFYSQVFVIHSFLLYTVRESGEQMKYLSWLKKLNTKQYYYLIVHFVA